MLRWIILILIVIGLTAGATILTQYAPNSEKGPTPIHSVNEGMGPQPKVELPPNLVHEFGEMAQHDKGSHSWVIKNVGEANLELWMESSTCMCTIAKFKSEKGEPQKKVVVKPNDSTTIDLEWETRGNLNEYAKGATIGTNDPARRSFALTVKGKVFPPVIVYPADVVTLNAVSNEETTRANIAIFSVDRPGFKIIKVSTSRPDLILAKDRLLSAPERKELHLKSGGHRVDLEIKPGMPMGRSSEELVIETDHPKMSVIKVPISINATGLISIMPERLRLTNISSSDGATQTLSLLVRGGTPVKFTVAHKPAMLNITIEPSEKQKGRYLMTVTIPPGTTGGLTEDEIILHTDNPKAQELKIPVTVLISSAGAA